MIRWQEMSPKDAAERLESDLFLGLTQKEADKRFDEKKNSLLQQEERARSHDLRQLFAAIMPILLLLASVLTLLIDQGGAGYLLLVSSLLSFGILCASYLKARRLMEVAAKRARPSCRVLREGREVIIPIERLVFGDILLLEKGDLVPADARLLLADALTVREKGAFGERLVPKEALDGLRCEDASSAKNLIFAGSTVESGFCRALVYAVDDTLLAPAFQKDVPTLDKTPLLLRVKRFSAILSGALVCLLFLATLFGFFSVSPNDYLDNFILSTAFAASAMTEFYAAFAYITAGSAFYSSMRRDKNEGGVLLKRAELLDKVAMLDRVFLSSDWFLLPDSCRLAFFSRPFGTPCEATNAASAEQKHLLRDALLAMGDWYGALPLQGDTSCADSKNAEKEALRLAARAVFANGGEGYPLVACGKTEKGFYYGVILRGETLVVTLLGDERLLYRCRYRYAEEGIQPLSEEECDRLAAGAIRAENAREGLCSTRYLAVGLLEAFPENSPLDDAFFENALRETLALEGLLTFEETLHEASIRALSKAREDRLGVTLICRSGKDCRLAKKLDAEVYEADYLPPKGSFIAVNAESDGAVPALAEAAKARGERVALALSLTETAKRSEAFDLTLTLAEWQSDASPVEMTLEKDSKGARLAAYGCDALRLSADMLVALPGERGEGSLASLLESVRAARGYLVNFGAILTYLVFSLCMKLIPYIASLFLERPLLLPEAVILLGLIFDLGTVLALALRRPDASLTKGGEDEALLFRRVVLYAGFGVLSGSALLVAALLSGVSARADYTSVLLLIVSFALYLSLYLTKGCKPKGLGLAMTVATPILLFFLLFTGGDMTLGGIIALVALTAVISIGLVGARLLSNNLPEKGAKARKKDKG